MIKNISTIKLAGILGGLLLIYFAVVYFGGNERSKSFRKELVEIDTAKVNKIEIEAKGKTLELVKEDGKWKTSIGAGKYAPAQSRSVHMMLGSLLRIKPSRLAAKNPDKWKEYQVDSAGTRIRVYEGVQPALDLVIGRFGVQGQRSFFTYVRLYNEDQVYAADNFMGISFGTDPADYRNKQLLNLTTDSLKEIRFDYPADSAFTIVKADNKWKLGQQQLDSATVAHYLNDVRYINSSAFVDDVPAGTLNSPAFSIIFMENNGKEISVQAYQHPTYKWILHSSLNPESYFSDQKALQKLLRDKRSLLNPSKK